MNVYSTNGTINTILEWTGVFILLFFIIYLYGINYYDIYDYIDYMFSPEYQNQQLKKYLNGKNNHDEEQYSLRPKLIRVPRKDLNDIAFPITDGSNGFK